MVNLTVGGAISLVFVAVFLFFLTWSVIFVTVTAFACLCRSLKDRRDSWTFNKRNAKIALGILLVLIPFYIHWFYETNFAEKKMGAHAAEIGGPRESLKAIFDHAQRVASAAVPPELEDVAARLNEEADIARQILELEEEEDLTDEDQLEMISYLEELNTLIEEEEVRKTTTTTPSDKGAEEPPILDAAEFEDDVSATSASDRREQLLQIVRTIDAQVDSEIDAEVDDIIAAATEGGGALKDFLEANNLTFSKLLNDPVGHAKDLAQFLKLANELKVVNYTVPEKFQSRFFPEEETIILSDEPSATIVYDEPKTTPVPTTTEAPPSTTTSTATPASNTVGENFPGTHENYWYMLGVFVAFAFLVLFVTYLCCADIVLPHLHVCAWPFVQMYRLCVRGYRRMRHTE